MRIHIWWLPITCSHGSNDVAPVRAFQDPCTEESRSGMIKAFPRPKAPSIDNTCFGASRM